MLKALRPRYEAHHKIKIDDSALVAAAQLSQRYISDRFLPDKAIDLIDEAASKLHIDMESKPPDIKTLDEQIKLSQDKEEAAVTAGGFCHRPPSIKQEIVKIEQERNEREAAWRKELRLINR